MEFGNLEIPYVFPIFQISLPRVISKVLFGGIMIPTLIKTVTLTYILTDIYIIILSIYILVILYGLQWVIISYYEF